MAKKRRPDPVQAQKTVETPVATEVNPAARTWSINDFKVQAIIISIIAFVFYINSSLNEYAHDDGIVIVKNEYVLEGFAGIGKILTKDAYDSYYRQLNTTNQLHGGRYRPLSIVTFAIEQQFFGAIPEEHIDSVLKQNVAYGMHGAQEQKMISNMHVRHVFNVLWYIASLIALLYFLRYVVFKNNVMMAFIAAFLFAIHPIHTEVVANVKSRDEIMSLLFMCLTFIFAFKYQEQKNMKLLFAALGFYFLGFLSKEYAITLIVLLPLSLYLFNKMSIKDSVKAFLPFTIVIAAYLALRYNTASVDATSNSDNEVLNNPYLFASSIEKLATEIATSLNYLKLLIFPHPLSADYSYNSIPYKDFSNPWVWVSIAVHAGLVVAMFLLFPRKKEDKALPVENDRTDMRGVLCFAIAIYLLHLALVCNIIFDIGATMGERLIYHSSVGFAIAMAYFLVRASEKITDKAMGQKALAGFMVVIIVLAGYKTIARNAEWKNDSTLFSADIKVVPNSVLVCANVAAADITLADFAKDDKERNDYLTYSITLLDRALSIHHKFVAAYLNRGIAYYKLGQIDKAKENMDIVKSLYPSYPTLPAMYKLVGDYYMRSGWDKYGKYGRYAEAIQEFQKGLAVDTTNADLWYNLGGAYYSNKQYLEAAGAFQRTLRLRPSYMEAQQGMNAALGAANATKQN
jgi:tetratricopeptide (TPR) repeat protein